MAIESISGVRRYRVNPWNPRIVDVQYKHGGRWTTYATRDTDKEANMLVMQLARDVKGTEEQEG